MVLRKIAAHRSTQDMGGPYRCPIADHYGRPADPLPGQGAMRRTGPGPRGLLIGLLFLASTLLGAREGPIYLTALNLRLKKDPSVVIPLAYTYANRPLSLPLYRDSAGLPADGWARKFIATRRFNSDQSAWIYYRRQDLRNSVILDHAQQGHKLCIWPGGSRIVIESYRGSGPGGPARTPIEIDVIAKAERNTASLGSAFLAAEWSYARFTPRGEPSISGVKVLECHQCHEIAFQLTGDLVFTHFP